MARCSAGYANIVVGLRGIGSDTSRGKKLSCIFCEIMKQERLDGLVTAPAGIDLVSQVQEVTFYNWLEDLGLRKSKVIRGRH